MTQAGLIKEAYKVISQLDLTKSAGFDGLLVGASTKGLFITTLGEENLARARGGQPRTQARGFGPGHRTNDPARQI